MPNRARDEEQLSKAIRIFDHLISKEFKDLELQITYVNHYWTLNIRHKSTSERFEGYTLIQCFDELEELEELEDSDYLIHKWPEHKCSVQ